ncbi:uncharacterized protein BDZ99DRAFT_527454 [Mytilinidion resinicola]|uniref:Protein kinase domain-containing protein n=1 Tax=Mytilinidion resinicola TaxID=574789 RepID=A0A6A6Y2I4_9PEZI|nr:uncharacterized protein BDZ99DRAFT_527454 [Mytilinidion resinicola]KAF2802425.1 hypothetical protein BDZ99DRAFT_527454 [Mytilinidion resinicola]
MLYLHSNNILFQIPGLDQLSEDELYLHVGDPITNLLRRYDNLPLGSEAPEYYVTQCSMLFLCCDEVEKIQDPKIIITDFGEAFFAANHDREQLMTPTCLLPPEYFFHEPLGPKSDTWTLACTLFEILGKEKLFDS